MELSAEALKFSIRRGRTQSTCSGSKEHKTSVQGTAHRVRYGRTILVSTSGTMAAFSTGNRCNGKLEPSRSSTSKKMYEKATTTQATEIARKKTEEWKERKAASMPLLPYCSATGNITSCQGVRSIDPEQLGYFGEHPSYPNFGPLVRSIRSITRA